MVAMAILTKRSILVARLSKLSVGTRPIGRKRAVVILMTLPALNAFQVRLVGKIPHTIQVDMATDAVQIGVDALGKAILVDEEQNSSAASIETEPDRRMATQTIGIFLGNDRCSAQYARKQQTPACHAAQAQGT